MAAARARDRGQRGIVLKGHEPPPTICEESAAYRLRRVSIAGAGLQCEPRFGRTDQRRHQLGDFALRRVVVICFPQLRLRAPLARWSELALTRHAAPPALHPTRP